MKNKEFYNKYYWKERLYNDNSCFEWKLFKYLQKYNFSRHDFIADYVNNLWLDNKNILDLWCWEWAFFKLLKWNNNLYWLDIAGVRLQKINEWKYNIVEWDLDETFPFEDNFFDIITSMAVMEHIFSVEHHLLESYKVLKDNWTFILEVPNVAFLPNRIRLLFWNTPITWDWWEAWDDNHLHSFTKNDLKWYLEKFGFKVKKITWTWIFGKFRNWWPSLLCGDLIYICSKN
ncbi:MAG: Methyltransferase [uncultured bacterium (gcode 4)]|uniref:Methyltransferase n=1 Tax=uncultured bacterium (gcode 4) TaxID=1234023 RepID=K2G804_9BACT|nr:MAG: Methyltransferase [uncultured bacterium (gcode 4)]